MGSSDEIGPRERWLWMALRVLNQILEVPNLGKTPQGPSGSDLAIFGENLARKNTFKYPSGVRGILMNVWGLFS